MKKLILLLMTVACFGIAQAQTIVQARWRNTANNNQYSGLSYPTTNANFLSTQAQIATLASDYRAVIFVQNNTNNDFAAGDSIKVAVFVNGRQITNLVRTFVLSSGLQKDSVTGWLLNEYVVIPSVSQWGENTFTYKVVQHNETAVTDASTNNSMTLSFNISGAVSVVQARWADAEGNLLQNIPYTSSDDSLLTKVTQLRSLPNLSGYYSVVWIQNNSGNDLAQGDSVKLAISINGRQITTWKITLPATLKQDSAKYFFINEYVVVPGLTQWGKNTYSYNVVKYGTTDVIDHPVNNSMTITFEKGSTPPTGIVENALEEVKVYPNPVRNILHINNVEKANIDIYSITGQRVKTIKNITGNQDIDVSDMANGMYILRMQDGQNTRVEKIQVVK